MSKGKKDAALAFFRRNGMALLLCAGLFTLVYQVTFCFRGNGDSDYIDHLLWAVAMDGRAMLESFYNGQERLWHICVQLIHRAGVSNIWMCAALVTAAADTAAYFLVFKTWDRALSERTPRWLLALAVGTVFVVSSLTVPGQSFYTDRSAVNTWHNPTNIMVRPFAAAVFFMTVNIYNRRLCGQHAILPDPAEARRGFVFSGGFLAQFRVPVFTRSELVLYPLCLLLSVYSKPSFLQFFAPAIFLFLLPGVFRTRGKLLPFCLKLALAYLPAVIVLYRQFLAFFSGGISLGIPASADTVTADSLFPVIHSAGVQIYLSGVSFTSAGSFLRSLFSLLLGLLYPCAFPLFILAISRRRGAVLSLGGLGMAVGQLEALLLHETGSRAYHGNFSWGFYLSVWLFWVAAIGIYADLLREKSLSGRLARWGGTALLLWHLACGAAYVATILRTGQYFI